MNGLTPRQHETLGFIGGFIAAHGFSPSVREIGAGISSPSSGETHRLLLQLVQRGAITMLPRRARSIAVVTSPRRETSSPRREASSPRRIVTPPSPVETSGVTP